MLKSEEEESSVDLNDRRRKILRAIIEDYILTAEPVGSSAFLKNHNLGVSSATVRNEMAVLEEMGYLDKPHTSAGRIPSYLGYRVYVDELMSQYTLTLGEINRIKLSLQNQYLELSRLLSTVSDIASNLTNYTTVITSSVQARAVIKNIKLIYIDMFSFVAILVVGDGIVKNRTIRTMKPVAAEVIDKLSVYLTNRFAGIDVSMITKELAEAEKEVLPVEAELLNPIFDFLLQTAESFADEEIVVAGATNIFDYPEFNDIKRMKEFLHLVKDENKSFMKEISSDGEAVSVTIGKESPILAQHGLSAVSLNYSVGDNVKGKLAILGPTRMEYARVVSTLRFLAQCIDEYINRGDL